MKSIDDALELRGRIFGAFEMAELGAAKGEDVDHLLSFVVVGAGPTGVEMAGQIAELARHTLHRDFRYINTRHARVILIDAASQVLPPFGAKLGEKTKEALADLGVEVQLGTMVTDVDELGLVVEDKDGNERRIDAVTKIWAAGVQASPLGATLAEQSGASLDRAGRIGVNPDLTLPGHPEVFVVGDMIALNNLPGVAQVAIQGAKFAAKEIKARVKGKAPQEPFKYFDKGSMATISRWNAVAMIGKLRLSGFIAWLMWLGVHLIYLTGFKNQIAAFMHWTVTFLSNDRSQRTTTQQQVFARRALNRLPGGAQSWSATRWRRGPQGRAGGDGPPRSHDSPTRGSAAGPSSTQPPTERPSSSLEAGRPLVVLVDRLAGPAGEDEDPLGLDGGLAVAAPQLGLGERLRALDAVDPGLGGAVAERGGLDVAQLQRARHPRATTGSSRLAQDLVEHERCHAAVHHARRAFVEGAEPERRPGASLVGVVDLQRRGDRVAQTDDRVAMASDGALRAHAHPEGAGDLLLAQASGEALDLRLHLGDDLRGDRRTK